MPDEPVDPRKDGRWQPPDLRNILPPPPPPPWEVFPPPPPPWEKEKDGEKKPPKPAEQGSATEG